MDRGILVDRLKFDPINQSNFNRLRYFNYTAKVGLEAKGEAHGGMSLFAASLVCGLASPLLTHTAPLRLIAPLKVAGPDPALPDVSRSGLISLQEASGSSLRRTSGLSSLRYNLSLLSMVALSFSFRAIGVLSFVAVVSSLLPSMVAVRAAGCRHPVLALYVALEGVFYVACCLLAARMSVPGKRRPASWDRAARLQAWQKILADQTQPTKRFVEGWFMRDGHGRGRTAIRATLVALGLVCGEISDEVAVARRVVYEELSIGDVRAWLAGNFFEATPQALQPADHEELDEHIRMLERTTGAALRPTERQTASVRPMLPTVDAVRWLHRPLLYYMLTDAIFGRILTPRILKRRGFIRRRRHGLQYYAFDPSPAAEFGSSVAAASDEADLENWMEDDSDSSMALSSHEAVVFIHGVGVGPAPYIQLLESFISEPYPVPPTPRPSLTGGRATAAAVAAADRASAFAMASRRQVRAIATRLQGSRRVRRLAESAASVLPWELISAASLTIGANASLAVVTRSASAVAVASRIASRGRTVVKAASSSPAAATTPGAAPSAAGTPSPEGEASDQRTTGMGDCSDDTDEKLGPGGLRASSVALGGGGLRWGKALTAGGDLIEAAATLRPPRVIAIEIPQVLGTRSPAQHLALHPMEFASHPAWAILHGPSRVFSCVFSRVFSRVFSTVVRAPSPPLVGVSAHRPKRATLAHSVCECAREAARRRGRAAGRRRQPFAWLSVRVLPAEAEAALAEGPHFDRPCRSHDAPPQDCGRIRVQARHLTLGCRGGVLCAA